MRRLMMLVSAAGLLLATAPSRALPRQPGVSDHTLRLTPFATHRGVNAMDLTYAPDGSGRVFVSAQSGEVFAYTAGGQPLGVFLDLAAADPAFTFDPAPREPFKGLMYIAFHPDYAKPGAPGQGRLYTAHQVACDAGPVDFDERDFGASAQGEKRFALVEWQAHADHPDRVDPASRRRVLTLAFRTVANSPHAVGQIKFNPLAKPGGPDHGNLYLAVGDGDNSDYSDKFNLDRIQSPGNPFGKILRINPLAEGGRPYTVPADNPFVVDDGGQPRRSAVYALGLRDPQWFSFARDLQGQTVLPCADIGHLLVEEINLVRPGGNYGWPRYEGTLDFKTDQATSGPASPPVVQYGHAIPTRVGAPPEGGMTAIMGGIVVSRPGDPAFQGQLLFTDLPRGVFMHANYHHALTVEQEGRQSTPYLMDVRLGEKTGSLADVLGAERGDGRLGLDEAGRLYIVSKQSNTIFKTDLVYTGAPVESKPALSPTDGRFWPRAVVLGVAVLLIGELAYVWCTARAQRKTRAMR